MILIGNMRDTVTLCVPDVVYTSAVTTSSLPYSIYTLNTNNRKTGTHFSPKINFVLAEYLELRWYQCGIYAEMCQETVLNWRSRLPKMCM